MKKLIESIFLTFTVLGVLLVPRFANSEELIVSSKEEYLKVFESKLSEQLKKVDTSNYKETFSLVQKIWGTKFSSKKKQDFVCETTSHMSWYSFQSDKYYYEVYTSINAQAVDGKDSDCESYHFEDVYQLSRFLKPRKENIKKNIYEDVLAMEIDSLNHKEVIYPITVSFEIEDLWMVIKLSQQKESYYFIPYSIDKIESLEDFRNININFLTKELMIKRLSKIGSKRLTYAGHSEAEYVPTRFIANKSEEYLLMPGSEAYEDVQDIINEMLE